ncbi:MAG TPA: hypothetical protein VEL74_12410 [Thermoanaerobaculia bacterium]|nr:hypothetical protein [Thermoanaerobaculia bacterium]
MGSDEKIKPSDLFDLFSRMKGGLDAVRRVMGGRMSSTDIQVTVSPSGISVQPYSASVHAGGTVRWNVAVEGEVAPFRLTIYFSEESPFRWSSRSLTLRSGSDFSRGMSVSASATRPGDYKYGVRGVIVGSGELIDDDDPYLEVLAQP